MNTPPSARPNQNSRPLHSVGLILAGGAGRRFGQPKAFAELPDGRTFLRACADAMVEAGLKRVVATLPPGVLQEIPVTVEAQRLCEPDLDMFASVRIGIQKLVENSEWRRLIILPVDHPLIRSATIATLATQDSRAAIPTLNGRHGHPIMLCRSIAQDIADGRLPGPTLREVLRSAPACDVPVDDPGVRANCNTPDTLKEAWANVYG